MYVCVPCNRRESVWRRFRAHMLTEHQVNERNLLRRVAQLQAADAFAVRSENGNWFLFGQPELL